MENLPKKNIFKVPDNYFEQLTESVLEKNASRKTRVLYYRSIAAAAVVIISVSLFIFKSEMNSYDYLDNKLTEDINLYINAGYWTADDMLSLSDDPNYILDQIINDEWGYYEINDDYGFEEDIWY
ncbi:hypothetical protein [Belliella pelovolcani]|uniref:hypothetical protein n=1 Tax=Belliella pelovolcani TaxID=529505 RepID=UPI00391926EB